ncbi:hypothetical protein TI39_contig5832g00007 [Zymoseptoria brevis]|uniref:Uncharacterized protein n=1 Tax=Zymoseptoria brevis TaxID=1047168 RepID=A0A0F4G8W5_9PEZI|nr:hypothetical protein TI39_contig5832g00007 [Zymoseptoria brevis]
MAPRFLVDLHKSHLGLSTGLSNIMKLPIVTLVAIPTAAALGTTQSELFRARGQIQYAKAFIVAIEGGKPNINPGVYPSFGPALKFTAEPINAAGAATVEDGAVQPSCDIAATEYNTVSMIEISHAPARFQSMLTPVQFSDILAEVTAISVRVACNPGYSISNKAAVVADAQTLSTALKVRDKKPSASHIVSLTQSTFAELHIENRKSLPRQPQLQDSDCNECCESGEDPVGIFVA